MINCIARKQEGDSWDFKRQWHEKKTCLLHDILCMANLTSDEDGIIIIGVDEEKDYALVDVTSDPKRKNTNEMVKFLRDKPFDGGIRPMAYVESVVIDGKTLDVIIIEHSNYKPYYLTERFEGVFPFHIYTRVGDTNTPIDKSADRDKVEALWRIRFGIDKSILERFRVYIDDQDHWISVDGAQSWYYEYAPEFRIETEQDDTRNGYEYYCLCQVSIHGPGWYWLRLKYHDTLMYTTLLVSLDGGNFMTAIPSQCEFFGMVPYRYYLKDDLNYSLHVFFKKQFDDRMIGSYAFAIWEAIVPVFSSKSEAEDFFAWVKRHEIPERDKISGYVPEELKNTDMGERLKDQYTQAEILSDMLIEYRNEVE